jgi:hypothetical protein
MVLTSATSGPTVKASPLKLAPNRRQWRCDRLVMRNPRLRAQWDSFATRLRYDLYLRPQSQRGSPSH